MAPRTLIVPDCRVKGHQIASGAIWISGATLEFLACDGTDNVVVLA